VLLNFYQFKYQYRNTELKWPMRVALLRYRHERLVSTTPEEMLGIKPSTYGSRMPAPIAALGLNQLKKIDSYNEARRNAALNWSIWAGTRGYVTGTEIADSVPVYLRYPVLVEPEKKENTQWASQELGVELGVWFSSQVHPVLTKIVGCPNSEIAVKQCVNFPTIM
jgi:dTDP-4-amino-4,6-dideoxygalactose transaminase